MGRLRRKRTKRARGEQPDAENVTFVDGCCELHRAGIEDPFPPDIGPCQCPCSQLHPGESVCVIDAPARRYLQIQITQRRRPAVGIVPVCLPCGHATARRFAPGSASGAGR